MRFEIFILVIWMFIFGIPSYGAESQQLKMAAIEAPREAKVFLDHFSEGGSEIYEKVLHLLATARKAAEGISFGFPRQKTAFLGVLCVMLFILLCLIRAKKRYERLLRLQEWLEQHVRCVERLENSEIEARVGLRKCR